MVLWVAGRAWVLVGMVVLGCAVVGCGVERGVVEENAGGNQVGMVEVGPLRDFGVGGAGVTLGALPVEDREWGEVGVVSAEAREATAAGREDVEPDAGVDAGEARRGQVVGAGSGLSVGGLGTGVNAETVDGLSDWQGFGAGPRGGTPGGIHAGAMFGEGAIRSLRVGVGSFSATEGGAAGVVAVETRGGTERVHGAVFGLGRESAWAAANPFSVVSRYAAGGGGYSAAKVSSYVVKPEDAVGQAGVSLGAGLEGRWVPVGLRGKVQGFGSVERFWRSDPVESAPATAGFFVLSAEQMALLGNRGVAGAQVDAALGYLDSLMGEVRRSSQRVLGFGRVDVEPGRRDHVSVGWIRNRFEAPAGAGFASASDAVTPRGVASVGDATVRVDAVTGAWAHAFGARVMNDVRGQWARDWEFETARAPLPQEPAIGPGGSAPEVSIGPMGFSYGTPAALGKAAYPKEERVELAERLAWRLGRGNLLQVGGDWSRLDDLVASVTNADGTFSYDSGVVNGKDGGLVDWITDYSLGVQAYPNAGCPSVTAAVHTFCFRSFSQSFGEQRTEWVTHEVNAFAEDAWQAAKGLSVTAGVRWEYTLLPLPQAVNPALDAGLMSVLAAGDGRAGVTASFPEDRNNFGPRVGVSWAAPLGFAVRLGYGVFFGRVPGATVRAALADTVTAATVTRVRITPTTETVCPQRPGVSFGYPCDFLQEPVGVVAETTSAVVFAKGFRVPSVQRMSLVVEHGVGRGGEVSLGYSGASAVQLPGSVDLNVAPASGVAAFVEQGGPRSGEMFRVPVYTQRLLTAYGPVSAVVSSANATYNALVAEGRESWRGVEVRGSYVWSRAIDYAPQLSATLRGMTQFDPFADGYDKGRSTLDFTHRFVGAVVGRSHWTRGAAWEQRVLSDWRVSAIGVVGSGAPYSYGIFGGTYLSGGSETINGSGGATYLPTVGRNTLRLPVRGSMDLRVGREALVGGRWRVEGFAEAFNALNERTLTAVETRAFLVGTSAAGVTPLVFQDAAAVAAEGISTPAFGAATSSTSGLSKERQVEVGVRVEF